MSLSLLRLFVADQRRANPQVTYLGSYAHDNPNNNTKLES